jgi:4-hydroxybenzoyl-CoA thioesterase
MATRCEFDGTFNAVIVYERPIRFDEVDPAGIVFFARFMNYAHEAMENFFYDLDGGYAGLIQQRRIGFPTVRLEADFNIPLRYGDMLRVETSCSRLGNTSATLVHEMKSAANGEVCAVVRHVVVTVILGVLKPCPMPDDVRAKFVAHLTAG